MSTERSLFDDIMEMADLVKYIERVADHKCEGFHISFGISKGAGGHKTYSAIVVCQLKSPATQFKQRREIFQGTSVRHLLEQTNEFLKTI